MKIARQSHGRRVYLYTAGQFAGAGPLMNPLLYAIKFDFLNSRLLYFNQNNVRGE